MRLTLTDDDGLVLGTTTLSVPEYRDAVASGSLGGSILADLEPGTAALSATEATEPVQEV